MDSLFTKLSQAENIDLLAPLLGLGIGLGVGIFVVFFLSVWYFIIGRQGREDNLPTHYYNRHSTIQVRELRKKLEAKKKSA